MKYPSHENHSIRQQIEQFEELFTHYSPKVKRFAMKLLKSEVDAEDVAQDIFMKLWNNPDIWMNNSRSVDSYLFTMTRNRVIDLIRERYSQAAYMEEQYNATTIRQILQTDTPLDDLYCREIRLIVELTLEKMPERRKEIFSMSRMRGLSNREIAQKLNLSVRTVEHQIYLALAELKKSIFLLFFCTFL